MSTTTPNLGLTKPAGNEDVDIAPLNSNFDILDAAAKLRVADGSAPAVSVNQLTLLDNNSSLWKGLDEVRLYNNTDTLICKNGVTTGLLMQNNQIKIVPVTWNNNVPAVGTMKGYIDANGDYHIWDNSTSADSTSLATLRDSVSQVISANDPMVGYMRILKYGHIVYMNAYANYNSGMSSTTAIFTLPNGWRPSSNIYGSAVSVNDSNVYTGGCYITSYGDVRQNVDSSVTWVMMVASWIVA